MASISGKSAVSSILRKRVSLHNRLTEARSQTKVRFVLPHSKKVYSILYDYLQGIDTREYENLVVLIRDSELLDEDIHSLLQEATECISILNEKLRLFVESILCLRWTDRSPNVVSEYQSFLINLLSAHIYHANYAIDKLVKSFIPDQNEPEWLGGIPNDADCQKCASVHWVFNIVLTVIPICEEVLMKCLIHNYPYITKSAHTHEYYIHNLLWIISYKPKLRPEILHLIFTKLILLDAMAPREVIDSTEAECEDIFTMDDNTQNNAMKKPEAHALDLCMDKILNHFVVECHDTDTGLLNWDKTKALYLDMLRIFDNVILPTYNIHHVQFAMFTLCYLKTTIAEGFLNHLWKKVCTPTVPCIIRQSAVSYIASLIARGSFIPLSMIKGTLQQMSSWLHSYILKQDGQEFVNLSIRVHAVFYSVCQALFYVIAFRQKDLVDTKKNIAFLESLNLPKIVTCRINPLRVCQSAVVQNFAAVTRTHQLAYCYAIMENNARNQITTIHQDEKGSCTITHNKLDDFFPFDPYLLKRSSKQVLPFYLNYQKPNEEEATSVDNDHPMTECDIDDFLAEQNENAMHDRFSYGTSPGFKFKN